jgi:GNAT superfamily N-acetyltransferase
MVAYRFCRSDDIPLLVEGYNRCWQARFPDAPTLDITGFKRWIRDVQLWTSSCMVASDDGGPFGVLLGCKRDNATLIWRIAVHPSRQREGHARHLLTSLSSKLSILGPPTLTVEISDDRSDLERFFAACGYSPRQGHQTSFADWFLDRRPAPAPAAMVIPFHVADLLANQAFDHGIVRSWQRHLQTVEAQANTISGLAVASFDGIEAYLLARAGTPSEIVSFGSTDPERTAILLHTLLDAWIERHGELLAIPKVSDDEIPAQVLTTLGFRRTSAWRTWSTTAVPA